jgi:hypothetical protein
MTRSSALPRWESRDARDVRAMTEWVNDQLNLIDADEMRKSLKGENAPTNYIDWAIDQADNHRNLQPLKQAFPSLARFLRLPKRGHGKRGPSRRYDPAKGAAQDVRRIRALWRRHYNKKKRITGPSAEQIAAERWEIEDPEIVVSKMKKLSE